MARAKFLVTKAMTTKLPGRNISVQTRKECLGYEIWQPNSTQPQIVTLCTWFAYRQTFYIYIYVCRLIDWERERERERDETYYKTLLMFNKLTLNSNQVQKRWISYIPDIHGSFDVSEGLKYKRWYFSMSEKLSNVKHILHRRGQN